MKKWITMLLVASMLLSMAACGAPAAEETETEPAAVTETETETEEQLSDDLPDMDYGGRDYRIATFDGYTDEFFSWQRS